MSRQGASWDNYEQDKPHKARVVKKLQRINGLRDLLETWEPHEADHHDYVLELRAKLRAAVNQYEAMA